MNFSASALVKQSASQLLYYMITGKSKEITAGQKVGEVYASNITKSLGFCSEKRGVIQHLNHNLFFCIDAINDNEYIEIKKVDDQANYQDWYLQMSVLQACLYSSLLNKVDTLDTPAFRQKEGYEQEIISVKKPFDYLLYFGSDIYKIEPNEKVSNFYFQKLELLAEAYDDRNFDSCRKFDSSYKHKEFSLLKPQFTFHKKLETIL